MEDLKEKLKNASMEERDELQDKISYMEETDMAVVVSEGRKGLPS